MLDGYGRDAYYSMVSSPRLMVHLGISKPQAGIAMNSLTLRLRGGRDGVRRDRDRARPHARPDGSILAYSLASFA